MPDLKASIQADFERHDYKKVIAGYRDYVASQPEKSVPLILRIYYSQSLANLGEVEDSITALKNLLSDVPPQFDSTQLEYDLANLLFLQNRLDEARNAYQKVVLHAENARQVALKSKERLGWIRTKEEGGKGRDLLTLRLIDMETLLEAGGIPDGAEIFLNNVLQEPKTTEVSVQKAKTLLARIHELRVNRAQALLDEARRLYDQEKKYNEVREILTQLQASYSDVVEKPSLEALLKAVSNK